METSPGVLVHSRSDRNAAVQHWLLCAAQNRDTARLEWRERGFTLLRCGGLFTAIRIPAAVVCAAAGTEDREEVGEFLETALHGGPVFVDQTAAWFYALVPASTAQTWQKPQTECFGQDTYLGVPHPSIDRRHARARSYWAVPMDGPGNLCSPGAVSQLVEVGRLRQAEQDSRGADAGTEPR
ncbi:hypothetical protein K4749_19270 [Streptomyces sp. TRM72054]|uniref:hypothetical protein n=1 Tax=Streptomyces sp. TRM72054 TaxID=2870562 RepID=UPI001C8CD0B4|nr:hypothetical protein [Streptomyces sp. TRM72054]MBX9395679.1 hypothetical protein [Streptomyces sp. TRM72054]